MRRLTFVVFLVLATVGPARAWRLWGEPSDKKVRPVQLLHDQGNFNAVLAALTPEFMQSLRGTDLRQAYILMGESLSHLGRTDEAIGVYQLGVKLFPKNVDMLTGQGRLLHRMGLDEQAKPLFLKALDYEPQHYIAHLGLAEIFRRFGFLDQSASHYEAALDVLGQRADIWRDYAETLIAQRDWKTAELALRRAQALEPSNPDSRILTGFVRRAQGDLPGALAALDEALDRNVGVGALRAKTLWLIEAERPAEALLVADEILRDYPEDSAALWAKARAQLAQGLPDKAAASLSPLTAGRRADFPALAARAMRDIILSGPAPQRRKELAEN